MNLINTYEKHHLNVLFTVIEMLKQSMGDNSQLINDNVNHCPADIALFTQ